MVTLGALEEFLVDSPGQVAVELRIIGRDTSNWGGVENDINPELNLESLVSVLMIRFTRKYQCIDHRVRVADKRSGYIKI
jgi:hypothetical protein